MVINTRNFLLYLLCVGFLVTAITYTAVSSWRENDETLALVVPESPVPVEYVAEAVVEPSLNRAERLASMREKIAALGASVAAAIVATQPEEPEAEGTAPVEIPEDTVLLCDDYRVSEATWTAGAVPVFSVVEGARLLTKEVTIATTTASGTTVMETKTDVLLQLPLRSLPLPIKSCLPTDVVGIALDGSLIRNNEQALYTIFSDETLLGYALDGFPMYGATNRYQLDTCGGTTLDGQYRYYLSSERSAILYCFAGIPVDF